MNIATRFSGFNDKECDRILVAGNLGYIGPVLTKYLKISKPQCTLVGYDTGYFSGCLTNPLETTDEFLSLQIYGDVRDVRSEQLHGIDCAIYLAAISNDPMGQRYAVATNEINNLAAVRFASLAKAAGIRSFVYASSCSIYGDGGGEIKDERSAPSPLTTYAKSKLECEVQLKALASDEFFVTCMRFATACGASPRLRLDLVLNDFVASAIVNGEIEILSDGTPWRPLIDVEEMCRALTWAMDRRDASAGHFLALNVGYNDWNFTIADLAYLVRDTMNGITVKINNSASPDRRTYKVDFSLYTSLNENSKIRKPIEMTIRELTTCIESCECKLSDFRQSHLIRLNVLNSLRNANRVDSNLRWLRNSSSAKVPTGSTY